jgi:hypothetical protein
MTADHDGGDDGHRLDRLEARWRFHGPDGAPELRALGAAIVAFAPPGADVVAVGRAVFGAIRAARRDERAAGELREKARAELAAISAGINRLRETVDDPVGLGCGRIAALLDHRHERDAAKALSSSSTWLLGAGAAAEGIAAAHAALAAPGRVPAMARRIADRLIPVYEAAAGRRAGITRDPDDGSASGRFVGLVRAACALAGIGLRADQIGNAARAAATQAKSSREKST